MKPILLSLLLLPIIAFADAEVLPFQAVCDDTDNIIETLSKKYSEKPIVIGSAEDQAKSTMTLWVNNKTHTWTILATKGNISCVIGTGGNVTLITLGRTI
jgi:hypothetical protein